MKPFCTFADLTQHRAFGRELAGNAYFVVLHEGDVYGYKNLCPHRHIPLEWLPHTFLDQDTGLIRCSSHGALFLPQTGECISGPCHGQSLMPVRAEVRDNAVFLDV